MKLREEIDSWRLRPPYGGVRIAPLPEVYSFSASVQDRVWFILDAMDWPELLVFDYSGFGRVVAPFVVGISSEGNALMRGYQLAGESVGGLGLGWRVFQVRKMENLDVYQEFFDAEDFEFDGFYPWVYRVFKML